MSKNTKTVKTTLILVNEKKSVDSKNVDSNIKSSSNNKQKSNKTVINSITSIEKYKSKNITPYSGRNNVNRVQTQSKCCELTKKLKIILGVIFSSVIATSAAVGAIVPPTVFYGGLGIMFSYKRKSS